MSWRVTATLVIVAWGALAFGAVYPWAFMPLFTGCGALGVVTLMPRNGARSIEPAVAAALALVLAAIALQLVPLPVDTLRWLSPETDALLRRYAVGYPDSVESHALSIEPAATRLALAAASALTLMLLGLTRALTHDDTRHLARGVFLLGTVLAIAGIVQKAMWNGRIYGFWTPIGAGDPFGPFVNRNHFAGWMLMALALTIGYFCGRVVRGMREVRPGWRHRVLWFSSADASETILAGFAALLMALALTLTMSRSGIVGLLATVAISAWVVGRRQAAGSRRTVVTAYLALVLIVAVGWTGFDRLAARFSQGEVVDLDGRLAVWADTLEIAQRFPIAGTGLDTYGVAMLFHQTALPSLHFAEAHNDYLQLLAEGGAVVCVPAALAIVAVAWSARRRFREVSPKSSDYWLRVGAAAGILALAIQEAADFSLQMPGNAALFVVLLAIVLRRSEGARRSGDAPRASGGRDS